MQYPTLRTIFPGGLVAVITVLTVTQSMAQNRIQVRINRWLEVQNPVGTVTLSYNAKTQPARAGDRLQAVGDTIATGQKSTATLMVDIGIGFVTLAEKTRLQVQSLEVAPSAGHITRLQVTQGQARLKLRRFTNPDSRLEIITPAGLSGVRGTEFGLSVQPLGKTAIATLEGAVVSAAQGKEVKVSAGFQNFTIPGEPPSDPVPLRDDPSLQYDFEKTIVNGVRKIRLVGQVDPVNSVTVNGVTQVVDRNGRFVVPYAARSYLKVKVVVTTPLGTEKLHELALR
jgi:FecR protein